MLDIFNQDAFSLMSRTAAVNKLPQVPNVLARMGVFEEDGITTTSVMVEEIDGSLALVQETPRGGPGESVKHDDRTARSFSVVHYQRDDVIRADEVQGVRSFGSDNMLETIEQRVATKEARHIRDLDFTLERQRVGAVAGKILNKDGSVRLNLFTEFNVAEPAAINFALTTAGTKVRVKCHDTMKAMEDALETENFRILGLCGVSFWINLIEHDQVKATYNNWEAAASLRGNPALADPFDFGGISFVRYHTRAKARAGNNAAPLIADNACRFVAVGVPGLFQTRFAPADYVETVNTVGLARYSRTQVREDRKGVDLQVQSNPISLCTRPASLLSATEA